MGIFSLTKKRQNTSLCAVVPNAEGISLAVTRYSKDAMPVLETCEFLPWRPDEPREKLLRQGIKKYRLEKRPCTTAMGLGDYNILTVEAPEVPPEELRAAMRWRIKDLIDFHIDDAVIDLFDAPASAAHGKQNNIYVVVSRAAEVREKVDFFRAAGVNLQTIDIPELALRNVVALLPEDEGGVAFIYLTQDRGLIVVARQSALYLARTLDIGYRHLQQASEDNATVGGVMNNQIEKLILEIQRSLDYYDRYFFQPPVAALVLAPMAVELPKLPADLEENLGIKTKYLDLHALMKCDQELDAPMQARCLLAIGAALRYDKGTL